MARDGFAGGLKASRERDAVTEPPGNQLYRVEVHDEGERAGVAHASASPWPRLEVRGEPGDRSLLVLHEEVPWDEYAWLWREGRPVEVELEEGPPHLARLASVDAARKELRLSPPWPAKRGAPTRVRPIASYKWSRNNGADALPVALVRQGGGRGAGVRLSSPVGTRGVELRAGDVVEAVDERTVLRGAPGPLRRVVRVSQDRLEVTLDGELPPDFGDAPERTKPLLRRWNQTPATGQPCGLPVTGDKQELEHGVHVEFTGPGGYQTGDCWLIPARTLTEAVEWPTDGEGQPLAQPPQGGRHQYTLLAVLRVKAAGKVKVEDRRVLFAPLTRAGLGLDKDGPTTLRGKLHVLGPVTIDGTLNAGDIQGQLAHGSVGTHQLEDGAVTKHKLAGESVHLEHLAPEVGVMPPGFSILGESEQPPEGFDFSALSVEVSSHGARWEQRPPVPEGATGRVLLVTLEGVAHALLDDGQVLRFEEKDGKWRQVTRLPISQPGSRAVLLHRPQPGFGAAVRNGKLHVLGGRDEHGRPLAHHEVWDPRTGQWEELAALPTARAEPGVVSAAGWLFVLGGLESWPLPWWSGEMKLSRPALLSRLMRSSAEAAVYDEEANAWLLARELSSPRSRFGVAVVRERIHVVGGERKRLLLPPRPVERHEQFEPHKNRWSALAPLRRARAEAAVAAVDDRLYVAGGRDGNELLDDVERYSFTSDAWLPQEPLDTPVKGAGATVVGRELLVTGGTGPAGKPLSTSQGLEVASLLYVHRKRVARAAREQAEPMPTQTKQTSGTQPAEPTPTPATPPQRVPLPPRAARANEHPPRFRPPRLEPAPTVPQRLQKLGVSMALMAILGGVGALWPRPPSPPPPPPSPAEAVMGMDVSHHQGEVDWAAVLKEGAVDFAFVKATEGLSFQDPQFERNRTALRSTPLRWGAYHYFRPEHSGKEQAQYFLTAVGVENLKKHLLPPVLDVEEWNEVSTQGLINGVQTWLDTVEAATGRRPLVYTYHEFWTRHLNRGFRNYPLWLSGPLEEAVEWSFWQLGDQGRVAGIGSCVDQDMFRGTLEQLDEFVLTGKLPEKPAQPPQPGAHCVRPAPDGGTPHDAGTPDAGQPVPKHFQSWMTPNPARQRSGPKLMFPPLATRVGIRGNTTVRCSIQTTGSLKDCVITQPLGPSSVPAYLEMDVAVLHMLNTSTFEPVKANGQVVEVDYDFRLYIDAGQYTWSWL